MEDYSKNIIIDHKYWTVLVHTNQGYLGRCVVWCKRKDAEDLSEATKDERDELFVIISKMKKALDLAFHPDWMNYAFLGNEMRHLHGHIIPRYSTEKEFGGIRFKDERWGHNYQTDHSFTTPPETLEAVKREIQKYLD